MQSNITNVELGWIFAVAGLLFTTFCIRSMVVFLCATIDSIKRHTYYLPELIFSVVWAIMSCVYFLCIVIGVHAILRLD